MISGSLSAVQGAHVISAAGMVLVEGSLVATQALQTSAISGVLALVQDDQFAKAISVKTKYLIAGSTHQLFPFVGGDDWQIAATLLDVTGEPYDLSNAQILWTLVRYAGGQRVIADTDIDIAVVDPLAGTCVITVPARATTGIPGGRYNDVLRIVTGGITTTLCIGPVSVTVDPWQAAAPAALRLVA